MVAAVFANLAAARSPVAAGRQARPDARPEGAPNPPDVEN
jgi:hypothetical protein